MRCAGGVLFKADISSYYFCFAIVKTGKGTPGLIAYSEPKGLNASSFTREMAYFTACFGDNTSLLLYTNGFTVYSNGLTDRTALTKLPVVGERGSTDYFTGAFVRNTVQILDAGEQIIGGKHYGCDGYIALLDE